MAKNYTYNEKINKRFAIKGDLSTDGKEIYYTNSAKEETTISVDKCLSPFKGMTIELSIAMKTEEDLAKELEEA